MKWRRIIFLIALMLPATVTLAQDVQEYVLPARTLTRAQALRLLIDQGLEVSFRPDQLPPDAIDIDANSRTAEAWLRLLTEGTDLKVETGSAGYLLLVDNGLLSQTFDLYGIVTDAETGERLIGAAVQLLRSGRGTYTNEYGFYSVPATGGVQDVRVTYIGYRPFDEQLVLRSDTQLTISLRPSMELPQILVTDAEVTAGEARYFETGTRIGRTEVAQVGGALGEDDPLQIARLLPGVTSGADGIGGMIIRGSEAGHNLVLLDGVPVYGLSHAGGLFSIFSSQAMRRVDLYKEAIPARFGDRIGGVLDVHTRDGNLYDHELTVGSSLLSGQLVAEGPIRRGESSFLITGRYLWTGGFIRRLSESYKADRGRRGALDYGVHDFNIKLNQRAGKRGRFYFSLYSGQDDYRNSSWQSDTLVYLNEAGALFQYFTPVTRRESVRWGNTVAALRYNHMFGERTFGNFRLSYSDLRTASFFERSDSTRDQTQQLLNADLFSGNYRSDIQQLGLAFDGQHRLSAGSIFRFGTEVNAYTFKPWLFSGEVPLAEQAGEEHLRQHTPRQATLYGSFSGRLGGMYYRLGLRGSGWFANATDRSAATTFFNISPRLLLAGPLSSTLDWQLSYDRTVQPVHLLKSFVIGVPSDLWVPSTSGIAPSTAPQYAGRLTYRLPKSWQLTSGMYYRSMNNLVDYPEGRSGSVDWIGELSHGRGRAYGWESTVQRGEGRLRGWLAYTLARSERTFDDRINGGEPFPFRYDRRHSVNLLLIFQLGERTTLSGSWRFESGLAYSLSLATRVNPVDTGEPEIPVVLERNGFRLPPNHRLDINLHTVLSAPESRLRHTINFGVYNLYDRHNALYYESRPEYSIGPEGLESSEQFYKIFVAPVLPSLSYHLTFSSKRTPAFGR